MVPETNMPVRFYLSPNREDGSASILVSEPLDYETTAFFYLRVRAQNVAAVPLAAFTTVYINVTGGGFCCPLRLPLLLVNVFPLGTTVQGVFRQSLGHVCIFFKALVYTVMCSANAMRKTNEMEYAQQFGLDSGALLC